MNRIRPLHIFFYVGTVITLFACAAGTEQPTGSGDEGEGGEWGTGNASSSSSGGTAGGGGGGVTPVLTCDVDNVDCASCAKCAREVGQCKDTWTACVNSADCTSYNNCLVACPDNDEACYSTCDTTYPVGFEIFNTYAACAICTDCPINCNADPAVCP